MTTIHVARGTGTGPTETAAYDAALADAGVHNYNLVRVSSMIPTDASIEVVDVAPDLGPAGNRLTVVEGRAVAAAPTAVSAGLGWAVSDDGPGLFYEAAGETDADAIHDRITTGIDAGIDLREWTFSTGPDRVVTADATANEGFVAAVVVGAYGRSQPIGG